MKILALGSLIGTNAMTALVDHISNKIRNSEHSKEKMLFEEWQTLYGQIADIASEQDGRIEALLGFAATTSKKLKIPVSLFVIHTYNSFLIKVLAAE
ncbi:hypothetical protein, partial [Salmonirosea aquatica]|uniref:hypothetical protein n=1 Tax=Salmonirosea aquatica TaxID=2654236 RepID=UPI003571052F